MHYNAFRWCCAANFASQSIAVSVFIYNPALADPVGQNQCGYQGMWVSFRMEIDGGQLLGACLLQWVGPKDLTPATSYLS